MDLHNDFTRKRWEENEVKKLNLLPWLPVFSFYLMNPFRLCLDQGFVTGKKISQTHQEFGEKCITLFFLLNTWSKYSLKQISSGRLVFHQHLSLKEYKNLHSNPYPNTALKPLYAQFTNSLQCLKAKPGYKQFYEGCLHFCSLETTIPLRGFCTAGLILINSSKELEVWTKALKVNPGFHFLKKKKQLFPIG